MDSNWQGLQGNRISNKKLVSLRQKYGKKELLRRERVPERLEVEVNWMDEAGGHESEQR